ACVFIQGAFSHFCAGDTQQKVRVRQPLWFRDMYRSLNATCLKYMAQKLHDKDSSDDDEIFNKDAG
uniref:Uncharacterized protein n=1 Tax=Castor canadensis TaxID=51338 RepID=A0A8C0ZQM1_CASCN